MTVVDAWSGTNVQSALKTVHAIDVRSALLKMIFDTVKFLDCKKTLSNEDEVFFTMESLIEDFPVFKITEWKYVTDGMKAGKYGKYFERLKASEFRDAFIHYESEERARILENQHRVEQAIVMSDPIINMMKDISSRFEVTPPKRKKFSGFAGDVKRRLDVKEDKRQEIMNELKENEIKKNNVDHLMSLNKKEREQIVNELKQHATNTKENPAPSLDPKEGQSIGTQHTKE